MNKLNTSLEEVFWPRVNKTTNCWEWTGSLTSRGYGQIRFGGRRTLVHRISYEAANGPIQPTSLFVLHACDNRKCVNPAHLRTGTHADNMQDMCAKGRHARQIGGVRAALKTHCKNGHEFTPENTRVRATGVRICKACHRKWR